MELGKTLAELRRKNGISQEKLAEMVGVSRQAVTKWESGRSNPDTENLIRLAEILGVSLDELCNQTDFDSKPKPKINAGGHIFAVLSALILIGYLIFGIAADRFDGGTFIALLIIALPMHIFTHLVFWGMIKSGEFTMLAGYDPSIKYDTENMKRFLAGLDFFLGMTSASYLFLMAAASIIAPEFDISVLLIFGYILSFLAGILFMGYKFGDKVYSDPKDAEKAKRSFPSSVIMLTMILFSCGEFVLLFELKGYQNNTLEPFPMLGIMFLSIILSLAGYLAECARLKKEEESNKVFGKAFVICNLLAVIALILMAVI